MNAWLRAASFVLPIMFIPTVHLQAEEIFRSYSREAAEKYAEKRNREEAENAATAFDGPKRPRARYWVVDAGPDGTGRNVYRVAMDVNDGKGGLTNRANEIAQQRQRQRELAAAFESALKAAERGDAEAQSKVGAMLLKGQGCKPSAKDGIGWLRKAAAAGSKEAQDQLASLAEDAHRTREATFPVFFAAKDKLLAAGAQVNSIKAQEKAARAQLDDVIRRKQKAIAEQPGVEAMRALDAQFERINRQIEKLGDDLSKAEAVEAAALKALEKPVADIGAANEMLQLLGVDARDAASGPPKATAADAGQPKAARKRVLFKDGRSMDVANVLIAFTNPQPEDPCSIQTTDGKRIEVTYGEIERIIDLGGKDTKE